ncbi:hypothetical protein D9757_011823 [Collybiopsis confluens]|uniref:RING-type domain-containing protein n=1 Tax=Collybiopsis confluens TaxID=2823264 RepID=A0A8H5H0F7_9AGAR|nr:hypothetical protein D9757_011823 [Collybiopsis confluens]
MHARLEQALENQGKAEEEMERLRAKVKESVAEHTRISRIMGNLSKRNDDLKTQADRLYAQVDNSRHRLLALGGILDKAGECDICFENIDGDIRTAVQVIASCGHSVCHFCAAKLIEADPKCPVCTQLTWLSKDSIVGNYTANEAYKALGEARVVIKSVTSAL